VVLERHFLSSRTHNIYNTSINPLNAELNPICHLLALLAHLILHVSNIRVNNVYTHTPTLEAAALTMDLLLCGSNINLVYTLSSPFAYNEILYLPV